MPQNGAALISLGAVSFDSIDGAYLQSLLDASYGSAPLPLDTPAAGNQLTPGTVVAVRTAAARMPRC